MQIPRFSIVPNEPTDEVIFEAIKRSPIATAALQEAATKRLNERKALAARLTKMEDAAEVEYPKLRAAAQDAYEAVKAADLQLARAWAKNGEANLKISEHCTTFDREHSEIERALIATCDPSIKIFVSEMHDEWQRTLNSPLDINVDVTHNQITGARIVKTESAAARITARAKAIREVIVVGEEMRLDADQSTVPQRLEELRNSLPKI